MPSRQEELTVAGEAWVPQRFELQLLFNLLVLMMKMVGSEQGLRGSLSWTRKWLDGVFPFSHFPIVCRYYFKYWRSSLNAGVPLLRNSSYIIISVEEITAPASRILPKPTFQLDSAREPTASEATCTR